MLCSQSGNPRCPSLLNHDMIILSKWTMFSEHHYTKTIGRVGQSWLIFHIFDQLSSARSKDQRQRVLMSDGSDIKFTWPFILGSVCYSNINIGNTSNGSSSLHVRNSSWLTTTCQFSILPCRPLHLMGCLPPNRCSHTSDLKIYHLRIPPMCTQTAACPPWTPPSLAPPPPGWAAGSRRPWRGPRVPLLACVCEGTDRRARPTRQLPRAGAVPPWNR